MIRPATVPKDEDFRDDADVLAHLAVTHQGLGKEIVRDILVSWVDEPLVVMLKDEALGGFCRLRYSLEDFTEPWHPFPKGPATQLTHLQMLNGTVPRTLAPLAARGFRAIVKAVPEALDFPIWAQADLAVVKLWKHLLSAETDRRYIWLDTLGDAVKNTERFLS